MKTQNKYNNAGATVDALTEALGSHAVIDALLLSMTTEQLTEALQSLLDAHGLELQ